MTAEESFSRKMSRPGWKTAHGDKTPGGRLDDARGEVVTTPAPRTMPLNRVER